MAKTTEPKTTLRYIGPDPALVGVVPLPEGWPAAEHAELNDELRAEKLAFRCSVPGDEKGKPSGGPAYVEA